ncbi:MAG: ATP synthase subunit I [Clostridia bacterium]|nr:ATP synthase subunit I [Clostridia bacterium]
MVIQPAVKKETKRISIGALICLVILNVVALIAGWFDYTVLLGSILGALCAVLCFFMMAYTVQKIIALDGEESEKLKRGKAMMRSNYMKRLVIMAAVFVLSAKVPVFNWVATAIMLVSPRLVVMVFPIIDKIRRKPTDITEEVK